MKTSNETILIDMDGCIADFMGKAYEIVEQQTGVAYIHADTRDYWFNDNEHKQLFLDAIHKEGIYTSLDVITGAVRAINRLRGTYDVRVCSAPPASSKTAEVEKREWLERHFDSNFAESAIITRDKHLVIGRLLVEDNPHIQRDAQWQPVLFTQPWNRDANDVARMHNWGDIHVIEEIMREGA